MEEKVQSGRARLSLILSVVIFGTIGIFRKFIPLPSSVVAMVRGLVGMLFLLAVVKLQRRKISWPDIRRNLLRLCLSGAFIGFNWILLFEAYNYTTVAAATLCYYMAPILVILVSPLVLGERLTGKKLLCVLGALIGAVFVSGVLETSGSGEPKGILLGLGAAVLYACVMLLNQKIRGISAYDKTIVQLGMAWVVLVPYILLTETVSQLTFTPKSLIFLLVVGVIHTGVAYALYFGSMDGLKAQTVALFSYIDPIVAIFLSFLVLKEKFSLLSTVGAVLILGSTIISELPERKKPGQAE